jgi:hypothetical protein
MLIVTVAGSCHLCVGMPHFMTVEEILREFVLFYVLLTRSFRISFALGAIAISIDFNASKHSHPFKRCYGSKENFSACVHGTLLLGSTTAGLENSETASQGRKLTLP